MADKKTDLIDLGDIATAARVENWADTIDIEALIRRVGQNGPHRRTDCIARLAKLAGVHRVTIYHWLRVKRIPIERIRRLIHSGVFAPEDFS